MKASVFVEIFHGRIFNHYRGFCALCHCFCYAFTDSFQRLFMACLLGYGFGIDYNCLTYPTLQEGQVFLLNRQV